MNSHCGGAAAQSRERTRSGPDQARSGPAIRSNAFCLICESLTLVIDGAGYDIITRFCYPARSFCARSVRVRTYILANDYQWSQWSRVFFFLR